MVPLPRVWIRVRLTTTLPERPGPSGDTRGPCAYSPTGWRTGRLGRMRILALISSSVTSPSAPPGFTTAKGYTTLIFVVVLHCRLSHSVTPTRIRLSAAACTGRSTRPPRLASNRSRPATTLATPSPWLSMITKSNITAVELKTMPAFAGTKEEKGSTYHSKARAVHGDLLLQRCVDPNPRRVGEGIENGCPWPSYLKNNSAAAAAAAAASFSLSARRREAVVLNRRLLGKGAAKLDD
ncbi:hypothetical protein GW17_00056012 [Ensete ventricosum]|nr:hypothetical protein GW17_00056012 [Ensete ventricosum]